MFIEKIIVGSLLTNCYIVENEKNEVLIIDPGDEAEKIIKKINNRIVKGILITHYHFDHVGALEILKNKYNVPVNNFNVDNFSLKVINVPGHTPDLKIFYFEKENIMFVGDFLFKGTFGRVDFEESDKFDMINSLINIKKYPEKTKLFSGHGDESYLNYEEIDSYIRYLKYFS